MSLSKEKIKLSEFVKLLRIMQEIEPKQVREFIDQYMFTDNYAYLKEFEFTNHTDYHKKEDL